MATIPRAEVEIVSLIYRAIEESRREPMRLTRIGASGIGDPCLRAIWYDWRGVANEEIQGRVLRLFETGHLQEARIVLDLRRAGLEVWDVDKRGGQFTYNDDSGHFVVKVDGVVKGVPGSEKTPHILEIKTHNKNSFQDVSKSGVLKSKPDHYAQVHSGMIYSKLDRGLYVALCKDDESYYVERIVFDPAYAKALEKKILTVRSATIPPVRSFDPAKSFECKWCSSQDVCAGRAPMLKNCRTCEHSEALDHDGLWMCSKLNTTLSPADQLAGVNCELYEPIGG